MPSRAIACRARVLSTSVLIDNVVQGCDQGGRRSNASGEMRALYVALARTTLPVHDVHGRSTIIRLPWDEVERRFGRR